MSQKKPILCGVEFLYILCIIFYDNILIVIILDLYIILYKRIILILPRRRVSAFLRCKILLFSRESHFCGECSSKTLHSFNPGHTYNHPSVPPPQSATVRRRISQVSCSLHAHQLYNIFVYIYITYNLRIMLLLL